MNGSRIESESRRQSIEAARFQKIAGRFSVSIWRTVRRMTIETFNVVREVFRDATVRSMIMTVKTSFAKNGLLALARMANRALFIRFDFFLSKL